MSLNDFLGYAQTVINMFPVITVGVSALVVSLVGMTIFRLFFRNHD